MTPDVIDVPPAYAGGPTRDQGPASAIVQVGHAHSLRYRFQPRGHIYRLTIATPLLAALVKQTESGFVARCPQLETLGYGPSAAEARADLTDATREYLSILAEDDKSLSPRIAHHALYIPLLRVPDASWWFAKVISMLSGKPDAS